MLSQEAKWPPLKRGLHIYDANFIPFPIPLPSQFVLKQVSDLLYCQFSLCLPSVRLEITEKEMPECYSEWRSSECELLLWFNRMVVMKSGAQMTPNRPEFTKELLKRFVLSEPGAAPRPPAANIGPLVYSLGVEIYFYFYSSLVCTILDFIPGNIWKFL